jgi:hypothetical protein
VVSPTLQSLVTTFLGNNAAIYTWSGLVSNSSGSSISGPGWTDRSIQFTGTFGAGGTCVLQGSNDGVNWFTLHDPFSNALSFTAAALAAVTEICFFIRPTITGGDGTTNITAVLLCCNHNPN